MDGTPDDWTWENWMAVEAERSLPPTCYSCAIAEAGSRPEPTNVPISPDDPRLLLGGYGTTVAVDRLATERGGLLTPLMPYDQNLRAVASLLYPGQHLNAPELLAAAEELADAIIVRNVYFSVADFWPSIVDQGGYAPTPTTVTEEDQLFMVLIGADSVCGFMPPSTCASWQQLLEQEFQLWRDSQFTGESATFVEWLRNRGARDWFAGP